MAERDESCVQPAAGPIGEPEAENATSKVETRKESVKVLAQVGKPAPDFEANAYVDGGFKLIKLSDYKGQWVVVCFYPGDFTFV
jgi:peroxiredoxin (alkyl hydroperoxide reductase subunit C)